MAVYHYAFFVPAAQLRGAVQEAVKAGSRWQLDSFKDKLNALAWSESEFLRVSGFDPDALDEEDEEEVFENWYLLTLDELIRTRHSISCEAFQVLEKAFFHSDAAAAIGRLLCGVSAAHLATTSDSFDWLKSVPSINSVGYLTNEDINAHVEHVREFLPGGSATEQLIKRIDTLGQNEIMLLFNDRTSYLPNRSQ